MSHLSHIEVAEEFGGPGERPNMTALPDGFPSNSPVTQRNSDSMSRGHVQVGVVDTSACPNRRRYLALSRLRISDAVLFVVFRQSRESCPGQRRLRASRLLSNALKSQRLRPVYGGHFTPSRQDVRFTPESGHVRCKCGCLLWANSGHRAFYSITSSACCWRCEGTSRPSALAALRLITISNFTGAWMGSSPGFAPLRMRSA
jgi:hypothetical protein